MKRYYNRGNLYLALIPQHKFLWDLQVSKKQTSQNTWIYQKFHLSGAANITSKQKTDMVKVAIKNENITSLGGIYHIMDVFSKLGFEKLTESVIFRKF